jgi:hypothetical protein
MGVFSKELRRGANPLPHSNLTPMKIKVKFTKELLATSKLDILECAMKDLLVPRCVVGFYTIYAPPYLTLSTLPLDLTTFLLEYKDMSSITKQTLEPKSFEVELVNVTLFTLFEQRHIYKVLSESKYMELIEI